MFVPPPLLCVRNVCPPGDKQIVCPRGQTKRDGQTEGQTKRFIYVDWGVACSQNTAVWQDQKAISFSLMFDNGQTKIRLV